jgi:hypothetical protein
MQRLLLLIVASCLMSACASGKPPTLVQSAPQIPPIKVAPPASLTPPPQPLSQPSSGQMPDLETNHRLVAQTYHQLAARYCSLLRYLEIEHRECLPYLQPTAGP